MKCVTKHIDYKNGVATYRLGGSGREVARVEKRDYGYEYLCIFFWLTNPDEPTFAEGEDTFEGAIEYVDECLTSLNCEIFEN